MRNIRSELNINPGKKIPAWLYVDSDQDYAQLAPWFAIWPGPRSLRYSSGRRSPGGRGPHPGLWRTLVPGRRHRYRPGAKRLEKEIAQLDFEVQRLEKKLSNPGFVNKAPREVVEGEREKLAYYQNKRALVQKRIAELRGE